MKLIHSAALSTLLSTRIVDGAAQAVADYTVNDDCDQMGDCDVAADVFQLAARAVEEGKNVYVGSAEYTGGVTEVFYFLAKNEKEVLDTVAALPEDEEDEEDEEEEEEEEDN